MRQIPEEASCAESRQKLVALVVPGMPCNFVRSEYSGAGLVTTPGVAEQQSTPPFEALREIAPGASIVGAKITLSEPGDGAGRSTSGILCDWRL